MDLAQKNVLSGTGSLALDLKTAGANAYAMKSGLGGTLQLRLRDGAVKGINLTQTLRELKAVISPDAQDHTVAADSSKQTEFFEMDADLAFTKGRRRRQAPELRFAAAARDAGRAGFHRFRPQRAGLGGARARRQSVGQRGRQGTDRPEGRDHSGARRQAVLYRAVEGSHRRYSQAQPGEQAARRRHRQAGGAAVDKAPAGLLGR